ncbi:MAG: bifunctional 2-C-methyl-D-erythritol 4-phosphate cytidylyltransferase/2-C-methyl-D-erythritol 2,4-cyclodiphosphate synthase [Rhodospirillaceae bacterium]|nr:bifunctional 2-C-methyl-D-erythritol 4-phosphate cytidylyltransferase/2-C-methyl-D-erythritol 2,4-cyclodiphosphate synthase [Rhodospirillaceae bacterium]
MQHPLPIPGTGCDVLVVGAGRGARFGGAKQYASLAGVPVFRRSLQAFLGHGGLRKVVPVIHADDQVPFAETAAGLAVAAPVTGGASRQQSVRNGLEALAADPPALVLIHDAARPFVSAALIERVIGALATADGAIPAMALSDTIKRVDAAGLVAATVPRDALVRAQTPQGFRYGAILAAHRAAAHLDLTDDAAVLEHAGGTVMTVLGDDANRKITTPEDLARMTDALMETRTGHGFDAHRFIAGDAVMLCGVRVPHTARLLGHSDADVALHAATDAILGAIGAGDIGLHFPPSDPSYRHAPSERFLAHAMQLVRARGGELVNLDITIICERPKIGPHRAAMVAEVARIAGVSPARVSVKATTTEGMGFTGRAEGIAAQASATVRLAV